MAALAAETRARELIVPLLLLPLLVPVLIAAAQATRAAAAPRRSAPRTSGAGWGCSRFYDVVFVLVSVAVFDYLLED